MKKELPTRFLLVEDEIIAQIIFNNIISSLGCITDIAKNGEEALTMFNKNKNEYASLFLDLGLPDMSGIECINQLRLAHPHIKIPVIALTAYAATFRKKECSDAGFNFFIEKPITKDKCQELLSKIGIPVYNKPTTIIWYNINY